MLAWIFHKIRVLTAAAYIFILILIDIFFMEGHSALSILEIIEICVPGAVAHERALALGVLIHFYLRYL